jgi:hypothetical protein
MAIDPLKVEHNNKKTYPLLLGMNLDGNLITYTFQPRSSKMPLEGGGGGGCGGKV